MLDSHLTTLYKELHWNKCYGNKTISINKKKYNHLYEYERRKNEIILTNPSKYKDFLIEIGKKRCVRKIHVKKIYNEIDKIVLKNQSYTSKWIQTNITKKIFLQSNRKKTQYFFKYIYPSILHRKYILYNQKDFTEKINRYTKNKKEGYRYTKKTIEELFRNLVKKKLLYSVKLILNIGLKDTKPIYVGKIFFLNDKEYPKDLLNTNLGMDESKEELFYLGIKNAFKETTTIEGELEKIFEENKLLSISKKLQKPFFSRLKLALESRTRNRYMPFTNYFRSFHRNRTRPMLNGCLAKIYLFRKINKGRYPYKLAKKLKSFIFVLMEEKIIFQTRKYLSKRIGVTIYMLDKILRILLDINIIDKERVIGRGLLIKVSEDAYSLWKKKLPKRFLRRKKKYERFNYYKKQIKSNKEEIKREENYQRYYELGKELGIFVRRKENNERLRNEMYIRRMKEKEERLRNEMYKRNRIDEESIQRNKRAMALLEEEISEERKEKKEKELEKEIERNKMLRKQREKEEEKRNLLRIEKRRVQIEKRRVQIETYKRKSEQYKKSMVYKKLVEETKLKYPKIMEIQKKLELKRQEYFLLKKKKEEEER